MLRWFLLFAGGLFLSLVLTPLVRRLAAAAGALDQPDPRKVHRHPTPRWGGLALFAAVWVPFGVFLVVDHRASAAIGTVRAPFFTETIGLFLASVTVTLVGLADDRWGVPSRIKLLGQLGAAALLAAFELRIQGISNPVGKSWIGFAPWLAYGVTLLWVTAIVNAVNFIDGLDGLAAGVVTIAAITFFVVAVRTEPGLAKWIDRGHLYLTAALCVTIAGAAVGFLRYNFHPASIFMGDTGSMLLGILLAGASLMGTMKTAALPVLLPGLILGIPLLDVTLAIVRRVRKHARLDAPDREHLHHLLLSSGLSHRQAVLAVYLFCTVLSLLAVLFTK